MSTTKQQLVGVSGAGLVIANFWLGDARTVVRQAVGQASPSQAATVSAHAEIKKFFLELLFIAGATLIAGVNDGAGSAMLAMIVALGILFAIQHFGGK